MESLHKKQGVSLLKLVNMNENNIFRYLFIYIYRYKFQKSTKAGATFQLANVWGLDLVSTIMAPPLATAPPGILLAPLATQHHQCLSHHLWRHQQRQKWPLLQHKVGF